MSVAGNAFYLFIYLFLRDQPKFQDAPWQFPPYIDRQGDFKVYCAATAVIVGLWTMCEKA